MQTEGIRMKVERRRSADLVDGRRTAGEGFVEEPGVAEFLRGRVAEGCRSTWST